MVEDQDQKSPKTYPTASEVVEELKRMGEIGFPVVATSVVGYLKNMLIVVCMGRLGSLELAGGALAIGFTNITGYSVLSGLASGIEPLCSQSFGSRNLAFLRLTLYRSILLLLLTSLPISFLWFNLHPLMVSLLHQNPNISSLAAVFCRFSIPDLLAHSFLLPLRIYLRAQGSTWPLFLSSLLSLLLHLLLLLFAFRLRLGLPAIALSSSLTNFTTLLFLSFYIFYFHTPPNPPLSTPLIITPSLNSKSCPEVGYTDQLMSTCSIFAHVNTKEPNYSGNNNKKEWGTLMRLCIQSCLGVCLEWWWYELMTILAGYLYNPRVALATAGIVIQTTSLLYTIPTALSVAVSTRVGNDLGAGRLERARVSTVVSIGAALAGSVVGLVWTTVGRERWGRVFTSDVEVLELCMVVLPIIGVCELANCPQTTCCGILRGTARPGVAAAINLYSFYLVGAPVAILLGFVFQMGFVGLCYGLLSAQITCVVSMLLVVYRTDWEWECMKATTLVGNTKSHHHHQQQQIQTLV